MYKIYMFSLREDEKPYLNQIKEKYPHFDITTTSDGLTIDNIDLVKGFDAITVSQAKHLTEDIYKKLSEYNIKIIGCRSAGFDPYHVDIARKYNIPFSNVPVYSPNSVAEFVVLTTLIMTRKFMKVRENVQNQDFRWNPDLISPELRFMTVGIIGTGNIGRNAARLFKGMGANVIGYDLYPNDLAKEYLTYENSIEELLKKSDIISLHMPLTNDNKYLINKDTISLMKDGAFIVNAGRGGLVNTKDLIEALDSEKIAGAAIDTYENEDIYFRFDWSNKQIEDETLKTLINHKKVVLTPHTAFYTTESIKNLTQTPFDIFNEYLTTNKSDYIVN